MFIKEVVIDGFKSYAHRTQIDGFDQQFNAITGLNGSGKSNILDSICFVLGIKNLTQVRATNLQELVYKSGQAGVTKATVSITFDNRDPAQSPLGYEHYEEIVISRQVVIGGRNKYMINGVNAQNNRVEDLFRSVQMNVNNPHFIIMQGRITKVLNMKPPEILSMIEEAAGTKMYESKKQAALKTIEKKDAKLREIDAMLKEEITPTLDKLKQERTAFMEYQKIQREIEHLSQLVTAHQYTSALETKKQTRQDIGEAENQVNICQNRIQQNEDKIQQLRKEIEDLEKIRDEQSGDTLAKLETVLKEKQKEDSKLQSKIESKNQELKGEEKRKKDLIKSVESHKKLLVAKQKEAEDLLAKSGGIIERGKQDRDELEAAQKRLQALAVGLSANDEGEDATLANQLIAAKEEISRRQTEFKQAEMKLKHLQTELNKHKKNVNQSDVSFVREQKKFDNLEKEIAELQASLAKFSNEDETEDNLAKQKRTLDGEIVRLRDELERISDSSLQFNYKNPEQNFDRSKVKGLVANLIQLKNVNTATAIEVTAGGKLFNVVVDTEETGKKLLQNGQLQKRVTIIPLNKIAAHCIANDLIKKAKNLVGEDNCDLALSLVGFDKQLTKAMEYVFGNAFVCKDMDMAKKVTYNKQISKKSVTLTGEVFDPAGTLTGGSRRNNDESILQKVQRCNESRQKLNEKERLLEECEKNLKDATKNGEARRRLNQQFEMKRREADLTRDKMEQTSQHQVAREIQRIETEIEEAKKILVESTEAKKKCEQKAASLDERMKNADAYRETEMKAAEKRLADAKKRAEQSDAKSKDNQQVSDALKLEIVEMEAELTTYEEQLSKLNEKIEQLKKDLEESAEAADRSRQVLKAAEEQVNGQKEILRVRSKEINGKQNESENLTKDSRKVELKIKSVKQDIERLQNDHKDATRRIDQMKAAFPWIAEQEKFFGKHGTAFDFSNVDFAEASKKLQTLQENKEKLSRNINTRAMNMFKQAEDQYEDLLKKKRIVESDKEKIESVIKELDEKKKEALEKAWSQVNKDFGSIFKSLLPGTQAKLEPPVGMSALEGLEVRVAFGDVWKESLAELSGGQRSLIALSLILAMLLFKPAPIYILDEVDAALDVSHTQNIGRMLKTHFKYSQFIVVSLKEGMFTNANVLFRTKFIEGKSTVTRHVQRHRSSGDDDEATSANADDLAKNTNHNKKQKRAK